MKLTHHKNVRIFNSFIIIVSIINIFRIFSDGSAKPAKSLKKLRSSNEVASDSHFDYGEDDSQQFITPKTDHRKSRFKTESPMNRMTSPATKRVTLSLTPSRNAKTITAKQIKKQLNDSFAEDELNVNECGLVARNVRAERGKYLSLVVTPKMKSITAGDQNDDPMAMIRSNQRPIILKTWNASCNDP